MTPVLEAGAREPSSFVDLQAHLLGLFIDVENKPNGTNHFLSRKNGSSACDECQCASEILERNMHQGEEVQIEKVVRIPGRWKKTLLKKERSIYLEHVKLRGPISMEIKS